MKVYLPEAATVKSFDESDIFKRKRAAQVILSIIKTANRPVTFLIDGEWGSGKTYFLKQLQILAQDEGFSVVYVDAFSLDFHADSFVALAGEVVKNLPSARAAKKSLKDSATKLGKLLVMAGLKGGVNVATLGIVGSEVVDRFVDGAVEQIGTEASDAVESFIANGDRVDKAVLEFRNSLSAVAKGSRIKKAIIVIDELDRCRPDFALAVIERAKHFLSVEGLSFVFSTNKDQFSHMIKKQYGSEFDADRYVEKFFDFQISFKSGAKRSDATDAPTYIESVVPQDFPSIDSRDLFVSYFCSLARRDRVSLRDIERILSQATLFCAGVRLSDPIQACFLLSLAWLKYVHPFEFDKILRGENLSGTIIAKLSFSELSISRYALKMFEQVFYAATLDVAYPSEGQDNSLYDAYHFLGEIFGFPVNRSLSEFCSLLGGFEKI